MTIDFSTFPQKLKDIVLRIRKEGMNPVDILEERLVKGGYKPLTWWQKKYLAPLFDEKENFIQQSLVGYPNCGKTTTNAIALAGLLIFSPLKAPVDIRFLSPTGKLTEGAIFKEFKRILIAMDVVDCFDISADKVVIAGDALCRFGSMYLVCIPTDQEKEHSLRGGHSQGIFCQVFDECLKFPDWVFTNCAGNMNASDSEKVIWLCASNLDVCEEGYGYFVTNILYSRYSGWDNYPIDIDQEEDPAKKARIIKNAAKYYGKGTDKYNAMLYCKLPTSSGNQVYNLEHVNQACEREHLLTHSTGLPLVMGIDISSGCHDAYSAFCIRSPVAVIHLEAEKLELRDLVRKVDELAKRFFVGCVIVDASSNSAVFELIKDKLSCDVIAFKGASSASGKGEFNEYANARAEVFFKSAQWFRGDVYFNVPDPVIALMRSIRYQTTDEGVISISGKKEAAMKRAIRNNPLAMDMLDAYTMTFEPRNLWLSGSCVLNSGAGGALIKGRMRKNVL